VRQECGAVPSPWMPDETLTVDNRSVTEDSVVFLGDSLTHINIWQDTFPGVETANQGVGGNTTAMVLSRLQPIIDARPKKIFILIGANDLNYGVPHEAITEGQRQIIQRIVNGSPSTKVYVQSIFPFGSLARCYFPQIPSTYKEDILAINEALKVICLNYGIYYIDLYPMMSDGDNNLKSDYTADQIHLEESGYEAWSNHIESLVR